MHRMGLSEQSMHPIRGPGISSELPPCPDSKAIAGGEQGRFGRKGLPPRRLGAGGGGEGAMGLAPVQA
jgi:hypothetical protein